MNEFLENYLNSYGGEDSYDDMFLAKLTAVTIGTGALAGKYVYDWEEMSFDPATGLTAALAGGRTGTYSVDGQSPALDINNKHINAFPIYAQLRFRCVGDAEAVFDFDAQLNVTNISNRLFQLGITGTPTAGTFTITITNPDATTTTTGTIAYNASFLNVLSNVTTALNAVLGANYAECGGTSWATFYVRMGESSRHTLTAVNVGSLTGAVAGTVSLMSAGTIGWYLVPEPLKFDNRTGIKVLNDGTVKLYPSLSDVVVPASDDCAIQINTCPIFKWIKNVAGVLTEYTTDPGSAIRVQDGITVEYQGWCGPITAASWSGGTATVTAYGHVLSTGDIVTITGVTPTGYNASSVAVTGTTVNTVSYAVASDPGTYTSGGTITALGIVYCVDNPVGCCTEACVEPYCLTTHCDPSTEIVSLNQLLSTSTALDVSYVPMTFCTNGATSAKYQIQITNIVFSGLSGTIANFYFQIYDYAACVTGSLATQAILTSVTNGSRADVTLCFEATACTRYMLSTFEDAPETGTVSFDVIVKQVASC